MTRIENLRRRIEEEGQLYRDTQACKGLTMCRGRHEEMNVEMYGFTKKKGVEHKSKGEMDG